MAERSGLRLLRGALVAATAASAGYQLTALFAARRWRRRSRAAETHPLTPSLSHSLTPSSAPPISILKPVRGCEPHAARSFASFCTQEYPEYELLFGVADPDDPVMDLVRGLTDEYPDTQIRLVSTSADLGPNRKVCNLYGLAAAARYDLLLISDSDMRVQPDYLRRIAAAFDDPEVGLVTCPYRGAEPEGAPAALEALGIAAGFMPGVFVAALGRAEFAFGSTIALRRETLDRIGGFEGLVDYLADDFQMGKRVADLGLRVHLSSVVVDSVLGRRPFRETWARRLRWARTVRACRPLGHLGSALTHTTALALLTALASAFAEPFSSREGLRESAKGTVRGEQLLTSHQPLPKSCRFRPFALSRFPAEKSGTGRRPVTVIVLAALGLRLVAAWEVAVGELESEAARRWFWLLPVSDLVEAALWFCSLFGRTVLWRGQRYRLLEGGRIERVEDEK